MNQTNGYFLLLLIAQKLRKLNDLFKSLYIPYFWAKSSKHFFAYKYNCGGVVLVLSQGANKKGYMWTTRHKRLKKKGSDGPIWLHKFSSNVWL